MTLIVMSPADILWMKISLPANVSPNRLTLLYSLLDKSFEEGNIVTIRMDGKITVYRTAATEQDIKAWVLETLGAVVEMEII